MFGKTFYFSTIRKYVTLVGALFSDIHILKTDSANNVIQNIKVPITYSAKEKMLARVIQDPNIDRPTEAPLPLPLIAFEMKSLKYASDRKLKTVGRVANRYTASKYYYQYNPVPYDFTFEVNILCKNAEDGTKIVEQVLPYFTPDWNTRIELIPEMGEEKDISVVLNSVDYDDKHQGALTDSRVINWTFNLTLKGYIYGPVKNTAIIKFANTTFYAPSVPDGELQSAVGNTTPVVTIINQPGLTANGEPTSDINLTIPYQDINETDDYGFITVIKEYSNT